MENLKEIWKPIAGFEGFYEISNLGRVKSLPRIAHNGTYFGGRIMKTSKGKSGYNHVLLYKNREMKEYLVHRLVADAFLPKEHGKDYVNHKDENKQNNQLSNLEWCDCRYNNNYGNINQTRLDGQERNGILRPVIQTDKDGNFIKRFRSIHEAAREMNISPHSIWACCKGKYKSSQGYKFRYENEGNNNQK